VSGLSPTRAAAFALVREGRVTHSWHPREPEKKLFLVRRKGYIPGQAPYQWLLAHGLIVVLEPDIPGSEVRLTKKGQELVRAPHRYDEII
jgi:hypothetical protein